MKFSVMAVALIGLVVSNGVAAESCSDYATSLCGARCDAEVLTLTEDFKACRQAAKQCRRENAYELTFSKCGKKAVDAGEEVDSTCLGLYDGFVGTTCDGLEDAVTTRECKRDIVKANKVALKEAGCWSKKAKKGGKKKGRSLVDEEEDDSVNPRQACRSAVETVCDECADLEDKEEKRACALECYEDASADDLVELEVCGDRFECGIEIRDNCDCDPESFEDKRERGECVRTCVESLPEVFEELECAGRGRRGGGGKRGGRGGRD